MEFSTKVKLCATTAAVAVGCAGVAYYISRQRHKYQDAADAFNDLIIKTVSKEEDCDEVVEELKRRCSKHRALGFDCEWVTGKGGRQPVALLQLSSFDGYSGLFRLNCLKTLPASLIELLEDETIYKVGVAATDDAKYLYQDYSLFLNSTLDVRHIAELCGYDPGGLAVLAKSVLGVVLDKSWRVRCSDWEAEELSFRQSQYAAMDAHVAIKIFVKLLDELNKGSFLTLLYGTRENKLDDLCSKYVNVSYKRKHTNQKVTNGHRMREGKPKKERSTMSKKIPNAMRTKPLYHNCSLQAPDGDILCTCDMKKALWYVKKELADVVKEDPLTVRLRFEPRGRSVGDVGKYYQLTKENKCVICGSTNSYIRKNVVPREYRKYFPELMKDHSSHDVLLLCGACHQRSNVRDQAVRDRLAVLCNAPLMCLDSGKAAEDAVCKKIRSTARALLYHQEGKYVLPDARRQELESLLLQSYPGRDMVTPELLEEAAVYQVEHENSEYESHGLRVVEYFLKNGGLLKLEEMWRQHFLNTMQPKYMPYLWSIKHNEERLRVKYEEGRLNEEDLKLLGLTKI